MIEYLLRQSTPEDRPARLAVTTAAWLGSYQSIFTRDEMYALFDGSLAQVNNWAHRRRESLGHLVADAGGQILGFVGMALLDDGTGEITSLYVLPEFQHQGIGRALWEAGCAKLEEKGCQEVWVWVLESAPARQFYEHRGSMPAAEGTYKLGNHEEKARGYKLSLPLK